jgi:hypothetical protein
MLFRHFGGTSPDGVQPITGAYATFDGGGGPNTPLVFKDDLAAAETPTRVYPKDTGFTSQGMQYINDSAASIFFSLDGKRDHFELKAGENILFDWIRAQEIWLRGTAGGESYRLIVW